MIPLQKPIFMFSFIVLVDANRIVYKAFVVVKLTGVIVEADEDISCAVIFVVAVAVAIVFKVEIGPKTAIFCQFIQRVSSRKHFRVDSGCLRPLLESNFIQKAEFVLVNGFAVDKELIIS